MTDGKRILILGGGFGGVNTARYLERLLRRDQDVDITLVDSENFSLFTPLLPEIPSGSIEPQHIVCPLRAMLARTVVHQAEIHAIDLEHRLVFTAHCPKCDIRPLPYDQLVLAFGAVPNFFGIEGVQAHALTLKSLADATALHAHVVDKLEHAELEEDAGPRRELLTFVVAGGGFAGVEIAAELNDFVRGARRFYRGIREEQIRMVLVHSGPRILLEMTEPLAEYALRKLRQRSVDVLLQTKIAAYDGVRIRLSNGEDISSRTLIWTAGIAPSPIVGQLPIPKDSAGRIEVDTTLQVKGLPGIWALGDCAAVPNLVGQGYCASTAQHASRQARRLAANLVASLHGTSPKAFQYKPLGAMAGLGRRSAVAEILGLKFSGFFAWWLWRTVYLMKLPGLDRKLRVALDWTLDLVFPRDIVYLRSLASARGQPIAPRLPAGDIHRLASQHEQSPQEVPPQVVRTDRTHSQTAPRWQSKHPRAIRWMHWINFPVLTVMIGSGLLIYWANDVYGLSVGGTTLFHFFPDWFYRLFHLDHGLATGMAYHFTFMWFFAINGFCYVTYTFLSGEWRYLLPNRHTLRDARDVVLHDLRLRKKPLPRAKFNGAQRLAYTGVILMGACSLVTGLAIYKPTQLAWLTTMLGGYAWARAAHFILTIGYVLFFVIHITQVIRAGWNNFRAMVTGYELVPVEEST